MKTQQKCCFFLSLLTPTVFIIEKIRPHWGFGVDYERIWRVAHRTPDFIFFQRPPAPSMDICRLITFLPLFLCHRASCRQSVHSWWRTTRNQRKRHLTTAEQSVAAPALASPPVLWTLSFFSFCFAGYSRHANSLCLLSVDHPTEILENFLLVDAVTFTMKSPAVQMQFTLSEPSL